MSKTALLLNEILKNGKNTNGKEWRDLIAAIKAKPDESKNFANSIKLKIKSLNQDTQIVCLDLLDYAMVECKMPLHTAVSSKDFLSSLINLLKTRDSPEVTAKILYLIKKWGLRFESQKDIIPNFWETYNSLKNAGLVFPSNMESSYEQYIGIPKEKESFGGNNQGGDLIGSSNENPSGAVSRSKFDFNPSNYPDKYKKFVKELSNITENLNLGNEMINGAEPSKPVDEALTFIVNNLRDLGKNLMLAIENQIKDEKLMNLCLAINDDISLTLTRYDELKKKKKPRPFRSALLDEEDFDFTEKTKPVTQQQNSSSGGNSSNLIDIFSDIGVGGTSQVNNNNNVGNNNVGNFQGGDIFEMISGGGIGSNNNNVNKSQPQGINCFVEAPNNVKPQPQEKMNINDLINSLYSNDYGVSGGSKNDPFGNVNLSGNNPNQGNIQNTNMNQMGMGINQMGPYGGQMGMGMNVPTNMYGGNNLNQMGIGMNVPNNVYGGNNINQMGLGMNVPNNVYGGNNVNQMGMGMNNPNNIYGGNNYPNFQGTNTSINNYPNLNTKSNYTDQQSKPQQNQNTFPDFF